MARRGFVIVDRPEDSAFVRLTKKIIRAPIWATVNFGLWIEPEFPWLVADAVRWLRENLSESMVGFEWGAGRSTVYFSRLINRIVSIEHDIAWYEDVRRRLDASAITNVQLVLVPSSATGVVSSDPAEVDDDTSNRGTGQVHQFMAYANYVLRFPDEYFDFILVDGRARVACLSNAMRKLKPGGILVLDNSERARYSRVFDLLDQWEVSHYSNFLWRTSIFTKPQQATGMA